MLAGKKTFDEVDFKWILPVSVKVLNRYDGGNKEFTAVNQGLIARGLFLKYNIVK